MKKTESEDGVDGRICGLGGVMFSGLEALALAWRGLGRWGCDCVMVPGYEQSEQGRAGGYRRAGGHRRAGGQARRQAKKAKS